MYSTGNRTLGDDLSGWKLRCGGDGRGAGRRGQIEFNMKKQMEECSEAPFYVLGPLVTDIAPGYDHITSAIGAAMAGWHGTAMLCYVTPKEHLGLPNAEDVREGLLLTRLLPMRQILPVTVPVPVIVTTSSAGPVTTLIGYEQFRLSLDPERAKEYHDETLPADIYKQAEFCSMCGPKHCPMQTKITDEQLEGLECPRTKEILDASIS